MPIPDAIWQQLLANTQASGQSFNPWSLGAAAAPSAGGSLDEVIAEARARLAGPYSPTAATPAPAAGPIPEIPMIPEASIGGEAVNTGQHSGLSAQQGGRAFGPGSPLNSLGVRGAMSLLGLAGLLGIPGIGMMGMPLAMARGSEELSNLIWGDPRDVLNPDNPAMLAARQVEQRQLTSKDIERGTTPAPATKIEDEPPTPGGPPGGPPGAIGPEGGPGSESPAPSGTATVGPATATDPDTGAALGQSGQGTGGAPGGTGPGDSGPGSATGGGTEGASAHTGGKVRGKRGTERTLKVRPGEFVLNENATSAYGPLLDEMNRKVPANLDDLISKARKFWEV